MAPSWDEIHVESIKLALKIMEESYEPDVLIGILRGGYIIARIIADVMNAQDLGVVEVKFYKGVGERAERPIITQPLTTDVRGKRVLIVDDVVDSGRTLQIVSEQVRLRGAKDVRSAALYYKPKSIIKPDFFIVETEKWIFFPWELGEFLREMKVDDSPERVESFLVSRGIHFNKETVVWISKALRKLRDKGNYLSQ